MSIDMSGIYEEIFKAQPKNPNKRVHKIALNRREITSLKLHNKWNSDCILKVNMNNGGLYKTVGNCEELEKLYNEIRGDMDYKYPGTFELRK